MVQLTINNIKVNAKDGMTILDAAKSVGIHIPTLCHLKNLAPTGAFVFALLKCRDKET